MLAEDVALRRTQRRAGMDARQRWHGLVQRVSECNLPSRLDIREVGAPTSYRPEKIYMLISDGRLPTW